MQEGTDTDADTGTEPGKNKGEAMARGASASARTTVETRLSRRFQVYMVAEGLLVGLAGGAVVTLYRVALSGAEGALRLAAEAVRQTPAFVAIWVLAALLVCAIVSRLMLWEPNTQGSGIPQVDAEVMGSLDMPWHRVIAGKFVEGTLCCLGGLSLGREGPSVQLGAMAGKAVSRAIGRGRGEERLLVTCGAASGMSAAFNAPLTGVLFALEEIHREFSAPLLISVMAAAVSSDFLVSQVLGVQPVLQFVFAKDLPHGFYPYVIALGLFCGLAGVVHNRGMFACSERLFSRISRHVPFARLAVPFALASVAAFAWPELTCGGDEIVRVIMRPGVMPLATVAALLVGKYVLTTISFGSGAPGGTLFPLCVMGALVGYLFADGATFATGLPTEFIPNFLVLGIAGLFASVVRAPVTAVVLAFELTGSLDALLSVSIVSIISYVSANLTQTDPFYEHLVGNLLDGIRKTKAFNAEKSDASGEKALHTVTVGADSAVDGLTLADIDWPRGVRVVLVTRAGTDITPTGDTRLMALDEVILMTDAATDDDGFLRARQMLAGSLDGGWEPRSSRIRAALSDLASKSKGSDRS